MVLKKQKHAMIDARSLQTQWTPLFLAARHNNIDCVEYLLRHGGKGKGEEFFPQ